MSRIKGKNTKNEMLVRKFLHAHGYRYRLHDKRLPGKPDIVLPNYRTVIFVPGWFWHGHKGCNYFAVPKNKNRMVVKWDYNVSIEINYFTRQEFVLLIQKVVEYCQF